MFFLAMSFGNLFLLMIRVTMNPVVDQGAPSSLLVANLSCSCFFTLAVSSINGRIVRYEANNTTVSYDSYL